jgi:hypothetical protein
VVEGVAQDEVARCVAVVDAAEDVEQVGVEVGGVVEVACHLMALHSISINMIMATSEVHP